MRICVCGGGGRRARTHAYSRVCVHVHTRVCMNIACVLMLLIYNVCMQVDVGYKFYHFQEAYKFYLYFASM